MKIRCNAKGLAEKNSCTNTEERERCQCSLSHPVREQKREKDGTDKSGPHASDPATSSDCNAVQGVSQINSKSQRHPNSSQYPVNLHPHTVMVSFHSQAIVPTYSSAAHRQLCSPRAPDSRSHVPEAVVSTTAVRFSTSHASAPPPRRKKLVYGWVQNVSGSMAGPRMEASLDGFDNMLQEVLQPNDYLGVLTYNGDINTLHLPMHVHKVDADRDKASIREGLRGNTAYDRTYDAVGASIEGLQKMHRDQKLSTVTDDLVFELLLLTNGGDNCSSHYDIRQLAELIAHPGLPNFHFVVVAVSMSECDKCKLQTLCDLSNATFLDVDNLSDLQRTLHDVGERVKQRLVYTTKSTTCVVYSGSPVRGHMSTHESIQQITMGMCVIQKGKSCVVPRLQSGTGIWGTRKEGTGTTRG